MKEKFLIIFILILFLFIPISTFAQQSPCRCPYSSYSIYLIEVAGMKTPVHPFSPPGRIFVLQRALACLGYFAPSHKIVLPRIYFFPTGGAVKKFYQDVGLLGNGLQFSSLAKEKLIEKMRLYCVQ